MNAQKEPEVLIVGAGPTGLMLALYLQKQGIAYRLIDKAKQRNPYSRAIGIQPRTLELLDHLGIAEEFVRRGHRVKAMRFLDNGNFIGKVEYDLLETRYPFLLFLPQTETEQILEQELLRLGGHVERPAELLELHLFHGGVRTKVRDNIEMIREISYRYVIGCDGAFSAVRQYLGIEFPGGEYPESFALADLRISEGIEEAESTVFFHRDGFVFFAPLGGRMFRVLALLHGDAARDGVDFTELQEIIQNGSGLNLRPSEPDWITTFRCHHRRASRFRKGNVFLAGDAAHIHSPVGGQGMNTGIQDALNLGWKLACIFRGDAPPSLLETYEAERIPVAEHVLHATDRMLRMAELDKPTVSKLRDRLLSMVTRLPSLEQAMARDLSQLSVHYRHGPITTERRQNLFTRAQVWAGERLPDFEVTLPDGTRKKIYELVRQHAFHLFIAVESASAFGPRGFGTALHLVNEISKDFRGNLGVHWLLTPAQSIELRGQLPEHYVDVGGAASHLLGIEPCGISLVRPDYYVAFADHAFDLGSLRLATSEFWT